MRRFLAAVLLVGATALPAYADHDRFLTVSGDGAGYVDVTFDRSFTLDTLYTSYRTSGRVAGIYVRRVGGAASEDVVAISERGFGVLRTNPHDALPAGRYRVHLVADGRATVRMLARGLHRDVSARVTRRSRASVSAGRMEVVAESPVRYRGETTARLLERGSIVVAAYRTTMPRRDVPATWGRVKSCVERAGAQPCDDATHGWVPVGGTHSTSGHGSTRFTTARDQGGALLRQRYAGTAEPVEVWTMVVEIAV